MIRSDKGFFDRFLKGSLGNFGFWASENGAKWNPEELKNASGFWIVERCSWDDAVFWIHLKKCQPFRTCKLLFLTLDSTQYFYNSTQIYNGWNCLCYGSIWPVSKFETSEVLVNLSISLWNVFDVSSFGIMNLYANIPSRGSSRMSHNNGLQV